MRKTRRARRQRKRKTRSSGSSRCAASATCCASTRAATWYSTLQSTVRVHYAVFHNANALNDSEKQDSIAANALVHHPLNAQTLARMAPREIERVLDAQVELFEQLARNWAWVQVRVRCAVARRS